MERVIRSFMITGIVLVLLGLAAVLTMPWTLISVGGTLIGIFSPNPPIPEIKRGEFPFTLVYEIDGVQFTIEDTLICEYDGIVLREDGGGKRIEWKEWQLSGNSGVLILSTSPPENTIVHREKAVLRNIVYYFGPITYYMGYDEEFDYTFPDAACHDITESGLVRREKISAAELLSKYGIKLISWEIAPPLKNSFR